jgi:hypothetical protein
MTDDADPQARDPADTKSARLKFERAVAEADAGTVEVVIGVVLGISEAFNLASIKTEGGRYLVLGLRTPGIVFADVKPGQRFRCLVTKSPAPRVVMAEQID